MQQLPLFPENDIVDMTSYPATRYQGSKRKLADWLWSHLRHLPFNTALDLFGGTGVMSYLFKRAGKQVSYNDYLKFNQMIARALIENNHVRLNDENVARVLQEEAATASSDIIQRNFQGIYYTDEENRWLDRVVYNIHNCLSDPYASAIAWFALFQACIIKRPYNLFHRANLYMREAQVQRSFGNKVTWDTPFEQHFRTFVHQANRAVFDNGKKHQTMSLEAVDVPSGFDLVYMDPPYINKHGIGVDYRDFYHFLEGMMFYDQWPGEIDQGSKHRRLQRRSSPWTKPDTFLSELETLVKRHQNSIIVLSYRDDGLPSTADLYDLLRSYKTQVRQWQLPQKYVLSKQASHELLLIGTEA